MKSRNCLLAIVLGLTTVVGHAQANSSEPLVFTSIPEIPSSMPTNTTPACYPYVIENKLDTDSLPLYISLVPGTDPRISINHTSAPMCPATNCGDTLKPEDSCTIIVKVDPSLSLGQARETLTIEYSPRNGPLESDIIFEVVEAPLAVLQFTTLPDVPSQVIIGDNATTIIYTLTNVGDQIATGIAPAITQRQPPVPTNVVSFNTDFSTCIGTLAPGVSCNLAYNIQALPDFTYDLSTQFEYLLSVMYSGVGGTYPLTSNIDFNVIQPPAFLNFKMFPMNLPPAVIQGETSNQFSFVIENYGTVDAVIGTISNATNPGPDSPIVKVLTDTCSSIDLAPTATCTITLELDASASPSLGDYTNVLSIPYNNATTSPLKTEFAFSVLQTAAILELSTESIAPIQIPASGNVTFTLRNHGNGAATNLSPVLDLDYGFILPSGGTCSTVPFSLAAASSCTLTYSISPTLLGRSTQNLLIEYDIIPGISATASSGIDFYAYTATPKNAYVSNTDLVSFLFQSYMSVCNINSLNGQLTSCSATEISGVSSIDFTDSGTYGFTSAYNVLGLGLNDEVDRCDISPSFGSCALPSSLTNAAYGAFIKFYKSQKAYLSDFGGSNVRLCTLNFMFDSVDCAPTASPLTMPYPTAIGLLHLQNDYAYILNKDLNSSLWLCTIDKTTALFSTCTDSGQANLFEPSGTLDFVSAGAIYVYIPLQVFSNQVDILQCRVNEDGTVAGCVSVKSYFDFSFDFVVSSLKVISVGGSSGTPYIYIGYTDNITSYVDVCEISETGSIGSCTSTGSGFELP